MSDRQKRRSSASGGCSLVYCLMVFCGRKVRPEAKAKSLVPNTSGTVGLQGVATGSAEGPDQSGASGGQTKHKTTKRHHRYASNKTKTSKTNQTGTVTEEVSGASKRIESEKKLENEKQKQRDAKGKDDKKKRKEKDREAAATGAKDQKASFISGGGED